jgi:hypothetical protein
VFINCGTAIDASTPATVPPSNRAADGDFVRDDEMLEVDEGARDNKCDENPVSDRDLPWKKFPNDEEEECGEQFDRKIAEGDACAAPGAASAQ